MARSHHVADTQSENFLDVAVLDVVHLGFDRGVALEIKVLVSDAEHQRPAISYFRPIRR